MTLTIKTTPVPLLSDDKDVVHVRGTRVTLDTIVAAFNKGTTAEEISQQYPTLQLTDVYSIISYYLNNYSAVEAYLKARRNSANEVRVQNEIRFDPDGIRERLLARRVKNKGKK